MLSKQFPAPVERLPSGGLFLILSVAQAHLLAVDSVVHKAVIEVDEKGTVAAAATSIVPVIVSATYDVEFKANRPFMFMIKDNKTDAILFLGQVNKL